MTEEAVRAIREARDLMLPSLFHFPDSDKIDVRIDFEMGLIVSIKGNEILFISPEDALEAKERGVLADKVTKLMGTLSELTRHRPEALQ